MCFCSQTKNNSFNQTLCFFLSSKFNFWFWVATNRSSVSFISKTKLEQEAIQPISADFFLYNVTVTLFTFLWCLNWLNVLYRNVKAENLADACKWISYTTNISFNFWWSERHNTTKFWSHVNLTMCASVHVSIDPNCGDFRDGQFYAVNRSSLAFISSAYCALFFFFL